jgi:tetratricopeptide (TPR) repeat protein
LSKFAAVELLLSKCEFHKVIPHAEFILSKRPRSALAHHYLGDAYLGLGQFVDAMTAYRISLGYDPANVAAFGNLGVTLLHLGRINEALQIFEHIIDTSDNPVELQISYVNLGKIYENGGKTRTAELYRERARELQSAVEEIRTLTSIPRDHKDPATRLAEAMVHAEITLQDQGEEA